MGSQQSSPTSGHCNYTDFLPESQPCVDEAGAIPVGPLLAQALEDALHDMDFEILEIPYSR